MFEAVATDGLAVAAGASRTDDRFASKGLIGGLAAYLFLVAATATCVLVRLFPAKTAGDPSAAALTGLTTDQALVLLALCAGVLGSFLHAAQSLTVYVGNRELRTSWVLWYVFRPFVGGVLGLMFYFVVRAGLISANADSVSPYGVVSFGALAGWFSKQATDKLAEVFETLFGTGKEGQYHDKLGGGPARPRILKLDPASIDPTNLPSGGTTVAITGEGLGASTTIAVDGNRVEATRDGDGRLNVTVMPAVIKAGASALVLTATNPPPANAAPGTPSLVSDPATLPLLTPRR